jgi:hypothetical protein
VSSQSILFSFFNIVAIQKKGKDNSSMIPNGKTVESASNQSVSLNGGAKHNDQGSLDQQALSSGLQNKEQPSSSKTDGMLINP